MRIAKLLLLLLVVGLTACQSRPDYVIDEAKMTELLTDIHMAEGLLDLQKKENSESETYGQEVIAAVLDKYHVSKADYDTSLVWYSQNLTKLIRIYRHVDENLAQRQEYWEAIVASSGSGVGQSGDSVSLWRQADYLVMDEARLTDRRLWVLQADTTFYIGDTVRWQMHVPDMPKGEALTVSMALLYAETEAISLTEKLAQTTPLITRDTIVTLTCIGGPSQDITQIIATLHLQRTDTVETPLRPCVIDGIQMIRLHPKK